MHHLADWILRHRERLSRGAQRLDTPRGLGRRIVEECEAAARREGFRQLALLATLPGVPLYLACGFEPLEEIEIAVSDGVRITGVTMEKSIDPVVGANNAPGVGREFASSQ